MLFKPIARQLLASSVFDQLRDRIVRGEMAPGAPLPGERVLASLLGVNRNAVREGLKRLEQAGLVFIHQGGSTRVRDFRRSAGLEILSFMLVRADGTIDTRIVRGVVELRTALAPVVGRFAAARRTDEHVGALRSVVGRMRDAAEDTPALARLALELWAHVVAATDNLALELALNSVTATYGSVIDHLQHVMADEVRAVGDYEALVEAIADGHEERAARAAVRIVSRGERAFEQVVEVLEDAQGERPRGRRVRRAAASGRRGA